MAQESSGDNTQLLALLPLISRTVVSASDLREFGYTKSQFLIIAALSSRGDLTMKQVAGYISSSKEQATRAVAPLVDEELVERYVDPVNRTRIHVRLTQKGCALMNAYKTHFFRNLQALMSDKVSTEEQLELKQAVETMIRVLSKLHE